MSYLYITGHTVFPVFVLGYHKYFTLTHNNKIDK